MNRNFGVEIELVRLTFWDAKKALQSAGIKNIYTCGDPSYKKNVRNWRIVSDASLPDSNCTHISRRCEHGERIYRCRCTCSCDPGGFEVKTPILTYPDEIEIVKTAISALAENGAKATGSCGLHVHVDIADFKSRDLKRLLIVWCRNQHKWKKKVSQDRWTGRHSQLLPPNTPDILNFDRPIENLGSHASVNKNRAINIGSIKKFRTLEFRLKESTTDIDDVEDWIREVITFVNRVKKHRGRTRDSIYLPDPNKPVVLTSRDKKGNVKKLTFREPVIEI